jgi:hypothetical protein
MSDGIPNESALAQAEETAAALPNVDDPNESPDESEHDPDDPNDERNWPDAGDPSDHLNEANDRAAAVLRAAAEAREPEWDWRSDDEVLAIREQPLTGVWLNPSNAIVIMQDRPGEDEPEAFVFIRPESVPMLIRKMAALIGLEISISRAPVTSGATSPGLPGQLELRRRSSKPKNDLFGGGR